MLYIFIILFVICLILLLLVLRKYLRIKFGNKINSIYSQMESYRSIINGDSSDEKKNI